jgi:hypothetical protein
LPIIILNVYFFKYSISNFITLKLYYRDIELVTVNKDVYIK